MTLPPAEAATCCTPTTVERIEPLETPPASVGPGWTKLASPSEASVTRAPGTALPNASFTVAVSVIAVVPSASADSGAATSVEATALGAAGWKVTDAVPANGGPPAEPVTVAAPARVEVKWPIATPSASVAGGCTKLESGAVVAKRTVAPSTGFPKKSRTVAVSTTSSPAVWVVGAAATAEVVASAAPDAIAKAAETASVSPDDEATSV
jgi:hypothetical protein